jgi:mRNA interferase RelE/StbE
MAKYKVELTRSAEKTLFKLPKTILPKILSALQGLSFDPFPVGCRKLSGEQNAFRIRVQNYRIIYELYSEVILVKVLKIGHRKDIYR